MTDKFKEHLGSFLYSHDTLDLLMTAREVVEHELQLATLSDAPQKDIEMWERKCNEIGQLVDYVRREEEPIPTLAAQHKRDDEMQQQMRQQIEEALRPRSMAKAIDSALNGTKVAPKPENSLDAIYGSGGGSFVPGQSDPMAHNLAELVTARQLGMIRARCRNLRISPEDECKALLGCWTDEMSKRAASALIKHIDELEQGIRDSLSGILGYKEKGPKHTERQLERSARTYEEGVRHQANQPDDIKDSDIPF